MKILKTSTGIYRIALGIILVAYVVLSWNWIATYPLGQDEPFSVWVAQHNLTEIPSILKDGNNPPLYELVLHLYTRITPLSERSLRCLSVFFSLTMLVLFSSTLRKYTSNILAIIATATLSFTTQFFFLQHEARAYPLLTMLIVLVIFLQTHLKDSKLKYLALGFSCLAIAYTHYIGTIFIFHFLLFRGIQAIKSKGKWKSLTMMSIVLLVGYSPMLIIFLRRIGDSLATPSWVPGNLTFWRLNQLYLWFTNHYGLAIAAVTISFGLAVYFFLSKVKSTSFRIIGGVITLFFFLLSLTCIVPFTTFFIDLGTEVIALIFTSAVVIILLVRVVKQPWSKLNLLMMSGPVTVLTIFIASQYFVMFNSKYLVAFFPACLTFIFVVFHKTSPKGTPLVTFLFLVFTILHFRASHHDHGQLDKLGEHIRILNAAEPDLPVVIFPYNRDTEVLYHYKPQLFEDVEHWKENLEENRIYLLGDAGIPQWLEELDDFILVKMQESTSDKDDNLSSFINNRIQTGRKEFEVDSEVMRLRKN